MGWVKVHENLNDHWLWEDRPFAKGQAWIDLLDSETQDISDDDIELACRIFEKCAGFEDRFWKALL